MRINYYRQSVRTETCGWRNTTKNSMRGPHFRSLCGKEGGSGKTARAMLADGVPVAHIAKWTRLSIEDIEKV